MQYRENRKGQPVSIMGFGCMRFTKTGGGIDLAKAEAELMEAYRQGVNYFDTAYIYPGSEELLGEVFEKNGIRDKINIATKLPQYMIGSRAAIDKYFDEELKRLRTTYVDYYLMHHMTDVKQWEKLKALGIEDWIREKKESGQIRNIGFSYHGNTDNFLKILNDYDWDICLVQYNYIDELSQAGRAGVQAAAAKGIPVVIMEPLRGGKLVNMLPPEAKKLVSEYEKGYSAAELAFRWLWNQPEVTCVLSGMNSMEMVQENCRVASDAQTGGFDEKDLALIEKIKEAFMKTTKVGCTECRYCMPCPKKVDIPGIFRCYNRMYSESKASGWKEYFQTVALAENSASASQCIGCGKCEQHCPQELHIREELKKANRALTPFYIKPIVAVGRKYMLRKVK